MFALTRFLAWKYLWGSTYERQISPMVFISFLSIFIMSWAMGLIFAISRGFERVTHEKLRSINPIIIMKNETAPLNIETIGQQLNIMSPMIKAWSPYEFGHVIIRTTKHNRPFVAVLKAIDPEKEPMITPVLQYFPQSIFNKQPFSLTKALRNNTICIGMGLARKLDIVPTDSVELLYAPDSEEIEQSRDLEHEKVTIGGVFKIGIEEFDNHLILCSLEFFNTLFPDQGIHTIGITPDPRYTAQHIIDQLKQEFGIEVISWQELYGSLVSALKLEKYALLFILFLICVIACMNIFAMLYMLITQKRFDIAILSSLGCSYKHIMAIFLSVGLIISFIASISGLICAAISSYIIDTYKLISLPDIYYATHVPADFSLSAAIIMVIGILIVSFLALLYPALKIRDVSIAHILRYEG